MSNQEYTTGTRYKFEYKNHNLYVILCEKSIDINCLDQDKGNQDTEKTTLTGLGIIQALITLALQEDIDKELIASAIWSESRKKLDLADELSMILVK